MALTREQEYENLTAVLHFLVTQLWLMECDRRDDPVQAARDFATEIQEIFKHAPQPEVFAEWVQHTNQQLTLFFDNLVSLSLAKTGRSDA